MPKMKQREKIIEQEIGKLRQNTVKKEADVRVHIMDSTNTKVIKKFQCEKRVIVNGMTYFKNHLKDEKNNYTCIDIQV